MKKYFNIFTPFAIVVAIFLGEISFAQMNALADKVTISDQSKKHRSVEIEDLEEGKKIIYSEDKLPTEVMVFIEKHFANHDVETILQEKSLYGFFHRVYLNGKVELYFDGQNELIEIKSDSEIPNNIIPPFITDYIAKCYPDNVIVEWKVNDNNQSLILDSDKHLMLNHRGEFVCVKEI